MYSFADHGAVPGTVVLFPSAEPWLLGYLRSAGMHVQPGSATLDGADVVRRADVVIVDARSRNLEALDTIRVLRVFGARTGILVVDEFANEETRCSYFEAGADDVMCVPVNVDEVIARLRALLRRLGPARSSSNSSTSSGVSLDTDNAVLNVGTARIALSRTELDVLVARGQCRPRSPPGTTVAGSVGAAGGFQVERPQHVCLSTTPQIRISRGTGRHRYGARRRFQAEIRDRRAPGFGTPCPKQPKHLC